MICRNDRNLSYNSWGKWTTPGAISWTTPALPILCSIKYITDLSGNHVVLRSRLLLSNCSLNFTGSKWKIPYLDTTSHLLVNPFWCKNTLIWGSSAYGVNFEVSHNSWSSSPWSSSVRKASLSSSWRLICNHRLPQQIGLLHTGWSYGYRSVRVWRPYQSVRVRRPYRSEGLTAVPVCEGSTAVLVCEGLTTIPDSDWEDAGLMVVFDTCSDWLWPYPTYKRVLPIVIFPCTYDLIVKPSGFTIILLSESRSTQSSSKFINSIIVSLVSSTPADADKVSRFMANFVSLIHIPFEIFLYSRHNCIVLLKNIEFFNNQNDNTTDIILKNLEFFPPS